MTTISEFAKLPLASSCMMPDKKRPKTDSPATNKRVKGEKKEEVGVELLVGFCWHEFLFRHSLKVK